MGTFGKLFTTGAASVLLWASTCPSQISSPNLLFIYADDLGFNDLGCYDNAFYETPRIDTLAREGMKLTQHYSAGAVCSPTRTSIITGKFPARTHSTEVYNWGLVNRYEKEPLRCAPDLLIAQDQPFLADELRKRGYRTAMFGKWHIMGVDPGETGYDEWEEVLIRTRKGQDANADEYGIAAINRLTETFMENCVSNRQPFFAFVSHHSVHVPQASTTASREYFEKKGALPEWKNRPAVQTPLYAGMIKDLDTGVGVLLDKLAELGIETNTLVVFASDNGGLGECNFPLRGGKADPYEGGIRVPFIARWPGRIEPGSERNDVVVSSDYFRTLVNIAGGGLDDDVAPDSEDFTPVLLGKQKAERAPAVFHFPHYRGTDGQAWLRPWSVVRKGRYTYIHHWETELMPDCAAHSTQELYDVVSDPGQQENLVGQKPDRADTLRRILMQWLESSDAQIPEPAGKATAEKDQVSE